MAGLFEQHDRKRFETIAVSLGRDDHSAMRSRLKGAFEKFVDAERQSDREVVKLMREMEVDIAVDRTGFTTGARPGFSRCARRRSRSTTSRIRARWARTSSTT